MDTGDMKFLCATVCMLATLFREAMLGVLRGLDPESAQGFAEVTRTLIADYRQETMGDE